MKSASRTFRLSLIAFCGFSIGHHSLGGGVPTSMLLTGALPAGAPVAPDQIASLISTLDLTPAQQVKLMDLASRQRGNYADPRFISEVEAILTPSQRARVRGMIGDQVIPPTPPANPYIADAPASGAFTASFLAGKSDRRGRVLGGTEVVAMTAHGGKLYAATSVWKDNGNRNPRRGGQILVLDRFSSNWQLDRQLDPAIRTFAAMESFPLPATTTSPAGEPRSEVLLLAPVGPRTKPNPVLYRVGDGAWQSVTIAGASPLQVRRFGFHEDQVTGELLYFAACQPGGLFRGRCDSTGTLTWESEPELRGYSALPTGLVRGNGKLYVAIGSSLYRREDGQRPTWQRAFVAPNGGRGNLRALSAIPSTEGSGQVLLAVQDGCGRVLRIDPASNYQATTELILSQWLRDRWGVKPKYVVAPQSSMLAAFDPRSTQSVQLFGIEARIGRSPRSTASGWESGGWLVIRRSAEDYELQQIVDSQINGMPPLVSTRAMGLAPFASANDPLLFCGGYNTDSGPAHDTAWIFQAPLQRLLQE